jgi:hypothetical protein
MRILLDFKTTRGNVKLVRLDNGETWSLDGECNRCGVCCELMKMPLKAIATRKGKCKKLKYETQNGEKISVCTIMESRPSFCMLYPNNPYEPLYEECSFRWELLSGR